MANVKLTSWLIVLSSIFIGDLTLAQEPVPQSLDERIEALVQQAEAEYQRKQFATSLERYSAALDLGLKDERIAYNAACCAALEGNTDRAFELLRQAFDLGWINLRLLNGDSDLESLHSDPRWEKFVADVIAANKAIQLRWNSDAFNTPYAENISDAQKAAGLSKLWAEVKFNFVNFEQVPEVDWDALYIEYMPKVLETNSTLEYYRLLEELVAKLKDGHTNVYLPRKLASQFNARPGMRTQLIEDKVIVIRVSDPKLKEQGIEVGQELLEIDGVPVRDYAEANVRPYMSSSTAQDSDVNTYEHQLLRGPLDEPVKLKLADEAGNTSTKEVQRMGSIKAGLLSLRTPAFEWKLLDGNIAYIKLNSFGNDKAASEFAKLFDELSQANSMILDLRNNGGGNSRVGWQIMSFLTDKPFPTTRWHTLQYRPTIRAWKRQPLTKHGSNGSRFAADSKLHYKKPVVMLIGPKTFSAAEDMAVVFDMLDRGKIIGQATGGSTGQPLSFRLPGGGQARVCTKRDSYADGTEFVGTGIHPDIVVNPTIADVRLGIDTVLKAATEHLKQ